ncbi:hypothetical protein G6F31_018698 [Rhizopus arrhizus]|nr:hypothetical protein G6F31_018698 [Rhizopus arrhizus]
MESSTLIHDEMNAKMEPVTMPGRICGSTTRKNVVQGLAPRSAEASSSARCSGVSRVSVERSTNGAMMTMCPINSDRKLRVRPKYAPYCSSAAPNTMCGSTSGDISTDVSAALPGNS